MLNAHIGSLRLEGETRYLCPVLVRAHNTKDCVLSCGAGEIARASYVGFEILDNAQRLAGGQSS